MYSLRLSSYYQMLLNCVVGTLHLKIEYSLNSSVLTQITLTSLDSLDWFRILRMTGYGIVILGPSLHFWYNFVSRILPKQDMISTLKKMLLGQTTYGPLMTSVFFSVNAALQGIDVSS